MATGFDSELYLRELAQATLSAGEGRLDNQTPVLAAAQALVAAGCLDQQIAQRVLDENEVERRRRDHRRAIGWTRLWPGAPLAARRIALGAGEAIEHPVGTIRVRYVVFAADGATIAVSIRRARRLRVRPRRRMPFWRDAQIAGDRGEPVLAGFSGSGTSTRWEGDLHCLGPLDEATSSVAIDGCRVQLVRTAPAAEVGVEMLPDGDGSMRHLWQRAALTDLLGDMYLEQAIRALVAAGIVARDEPELATMRDVAAARVLDGSERGKAAAALPLPWSSVWRRRDFEGPVRTIAVAAATPLFDGVAVVVDVLESCAERWSIAIEWSPKARRPTRARRRTRGSSASCGGPRTIEATATSPLRPARAATPPERTAGSSSMRHSIQPLDGSNCARPPKTHVPGFESHSTDTQGAEVASWRWGADVCSAE